jgi:deferrochelatase/peroxidase EfeB
MAYPQYGILERMPSHLLLAALTFTGDRAAPRSRETLDALRELLHRELSRDLDDMTGAAKDAPSPETGELGFTDGYPRRKLTLTVGISTTGFDALGIVGDDRPQDLPPSPQTMWDLLEESPDTRESGDLVIQIKSEDAYINEHVVRRIEQELSDRLVVAWTQRGENRYTAFAQDLNRSARREARALIGFLDGTSNLNPWTNRDERALVFVNPDDVPGYPPIPPQQSGYGGAVFPPPGLRPPPRREPPWAREGTYMVVRTSAQDIQAWDRTSYGEQERIIGRFKVSGASLDLSDDPALIETPPAYDHDQSILTVPLNSHVRKANPRRPEDLPRRLFRRGYPLIETGPDGVRRGLVFICFSRTITTQFEFIFRAWMNNPDFNPLPNQAPPGKDALLERFDTRTVNGGYYFAPPIEHRFISTSWIIPA